MDLWLIRHAPARARSELEAGRSDASRPLTARGVDRVRDAARALAALGVRFERLRFSPWRRALETAELLAGLVDDELVVTSLLRQSPGPFLIEELSGSCEALVGHEPWLGELVGLLVFEDPQRGEDLRLDEGGVMHLRGTARPGGMRLVALYPAPALKRLAGQRAKRA